MISRLLLGGYLALSILKNQKPQNLKRWPKVPWILGHRGARAQAPENTIAAFLLAHELGADGVEFDVSLSRDQVPVVIHDHSVARTTDGQGLVKDLTASELFKLNASKPIPGYQKASVPSLSETLNALPDNFIVNVELKFSGHFSKLVFIDTVVDVLFKHQRLTFIVSSFDGELLSLLRKKYPDLLISLILSPADKHWPQSLKFFASINPEGLHISPDLLSSVILKLIKAASLKVGVWTVNKPKLAQKLWAMKVDGLFTDQVATIVKAVR